MRAGTSRGSSSPPRPRRCRSSRACAPRAAWPRCPASALRLLVAYVGLGWLEQRLGDGGIGRAAAALAEVRDEALDVARCDEHLTWLGALVSGDDVAALEHVDQTARARVAEAQA